MTRLIIVLTLGCKDTSYRYVIEFLKKKDVPVLIDWIPVLIDWIPGHSVIYINGNEIADHLVKEAAKETETYITDDRKLTSTADLCQAGIREVSIYGYCNTPSPGLCAGLCARQGKLVEIKVISAEQG